METLKEKLELYKKQKEQAKEVYKKDPSKVKF